MTLFVRGSDSIIPGDIIVEAIDVCFIHLLSCMYYKIYLGINQAI